MLLAGTLSIVVIMKWALILIFGVFIYRKLKPPTFPWLAAFFSIQIISSLFFVVRNRAYPYKFNFGPLSNLSDKLKDPAFSSTFYKVMSISQYFTLLQASIDLIVAFLLISEIVYLLTNKQIIEIPSQFNWTLKFRENAFFWGTLLIFLGLIKPMLSVFVSIKLGCLV